MNDANRNASSPRAPARTPPAANPRRQNETAPAAAPHTNSLREAADMIVFVIVLVLLLKTFVAEAFVIPTGSMATTLWGDQKIVTCPECNFEFPLNCSSEHEDGRRPDRVLGGTCPNCRYHIAFREDGQNPSCRSGDRVLVAKYMYDVGLVEPQRNDIVVFKYPETPQKNFSPLNYIKRLVGRSGETIAIYYGDIYVYPNPADADTKPLTYPDRPRPADPADLWRRPYMYENDKDARELFDQGKFAIAHKSPAKILEMRRPVYDNDHPARDLVEHKYPPRWAPERGEGPLTSGTQPAHYYQRNRSRAHEDKAWVADDANGFRFDGRSSSLSWLRYRNLLVGRSGPGIGKDTSEIRPELITDFLGYDTSQTQGTTHPGPPPPNWVGDLILDCQIKIESDTDSSGDSQLVLELSRGVDRFQARWDLSAGECTLVRITGDNEEALGSRPSSLKGPGQYRMRFANVDERLTVWVDGKLPFGDGVVYAAPRQRGPTANDLEPAGIAARGARLSVHHLSLWRDTYYTLAPGASDALQRVDNWSNPDDWTPLRELLPLTMYVQPGHYLCLGDNSPESADSRSWGVVPRRLMLGRALLVYWPWYRTGPIK